MSTDQEINDRLVAKWRNTFDTRVFGASENPFGVAGVLNQYIFDNHQRPYLDFTAAGGTMPLGQGYALVSEGITELVKFFYQTASYGQHIHGVQMEFIAAIEGYFEEGNKFLFTASEGDAFHTVVQMVREQREGSDGLMLAVNRASFPAGMDMVGIASFDEVNAMTAAEVRDRAKYIDISSLLVSPINPDTYEVISPERLQTVIDLSAELHIPIIWDETVQGMGWMDGMFRIPHYADYIVLGGALGGGIPLGAVVGKNLYQVDHPDSVTRLSGSSLAFAAGLHAYRGIMHLKRLKGQPEITGLLNDELDKLQEQFPEVIAGLTGESLLRGVVFRDPNFARQFVQQCREDGILLMRPPSGGRVVRIAAPMVCSLSDVEELAGAMLAAILKVRASDDRRRGEGLEATGNGASG